MTLYTPHPLRRWLCAGTLTLVADGAAAAPEAPAAAHHTFVIVHGAWGGGWAFREVDRLLTADGHKVYRPTLTGQGEKVHLATRDTNLTTHITDIFNVILFEDLHDVVLVGHSYGGMVITGVMDRVPERIRQVIFLDAAVPDDGESMKSLRHRTFTPEEIARGFILPSADAAAKPIPHDVPQPLKTWTEPVSFKNPLARQLPGTVVVFVGKKQTPEQLKDNPSFVTARARSWATLTLESDHNAQWSHPKELAALLEQIANGK
ncbi:MAG TPA: alpha/beta hydrolase family protein [Opitutaceae bacterium]|nr:alpha/beta hydrolase family protein [Opitutaceae bacterium]